MSAFTDMFGQLLRRQQASGGAFRLGAGVVGHTTHVTIAAVLVIGALALILERNTAVAIDAIIAVAAVTAFYLHGTWSFADKHPDAAALAGTSWPKAEPKAEARAQAAPPLKTEPAPMKADEPAAAVSPPATTMGNGDGSAPTPH